MKPAVAEVRPSARAMLPMGLPAGRRSPRGRARWYVLRVPEGREQAVCDKLKRIVPRELLDDAFVISKERWFKRQGAWSLVPVQMYHGYAFAVSRDIGALAKAIAKTTLPVEVVGAFGHSWAPLSDEVRGWFSAAMDERHLIRNSVAAIEDGALHVLEGPLVGQEPRVSKVDRHRRRCLVHVGDPDGGFTEQMPIDVPFKS